jgi:O-antigen ligase
MLSIVLVPHQVISPDGVAGMHEGKNAAGSVASIAIIAFGGAFMASKSFMYKCGWLFMLVSSYVLLYVTKCKTCFGIGTVLPLACIIFYFGYRRVRYFPLFALGITGIFAGFAAVLVAITGSSTDDVLQLLLGDPTLTGRTDVWALVIERIEQRPLLGYGWMAFWGADQVNPFEDVSLTSWISSIHFLNEGHNGYLDLTLEAGFIGLALGILVICRLFWVYVKLLRFPSMDYSQPRLLATLLGIALSLLLNNALESLLFRSGSYLSELFIFIYLAGELQYLLNDSPDKAVQS